MLDPIRNTPQFKALDEHSQSSQKRQLRRAIPMVAGARFVTYLQPFLAGAAIYNSLSGVQRSCRWVTKRKRPKLRLPRKAAPSRLETSAGLAKGTKRAEPVIHLERVSTKQTLERSLEARTSLRRDRSCCSVWEFQLPLDRLEARLLAQGVHERVGLH
jgi:hypothetical protein